MFDARDGDLDREVKRQVFMSIGKPAARRVRPMTLRLALLLILLGLVALLGLAEYAGAAEPAGKQVQKATGGPGPRQVTPLEKLPENSAAARRAVLFNFLQNLSGHRASPDAAPQAHQAQDRQVPLQLFPVTSNLESPPLRPDVDAAPWGLLVSLAIILWAALVVSVRSRRPW